MVQRTFVVVAGLLVASVAAPPAVAQDAAAAAALDYIRGSRQTLGLAGSDVGDVVVSSVVRSDHNRVTHVYLQQRYRGIEVWSGILNVAVDANGAVVSAQSRFVTNIASQAGGQSAKKAAARRGGRCCGHVSLKPTTCLRSPPAQGRPLRGRDALRWRHQPQADRGQARVGAPGGRRAPGLEGRDRGDRRSALVAGLRGRGDRRARWAKHDLDRARRLGARHRAPPSRARPTSPAAVPHVRRHRRLGVPRVPAAVREPDRRRPHPRDQRGRSRRARRSAGTTPTASPGRSSPSPAATTSTPTPTVDANNVADAGSDPDGGAGLRLRLRPRPDRRPARYRPAAIVTNLFYWNNIVHDVTYGYGFDEAAGQLPGEQLRQRRARQRRRARRGPGRQRHQQRELRHPGERHSARGCRCSCGRSRRRTRSPWPPAAAAGDLRRPPSAAFGPQPRHHRPHHRRGRLVNDGVIRAIPAGQPRRILDYLASRRAARSRCSTAASAPFVAEGRQRPGRGRDRGHRGQQHRPARPSTMGGADPDDHHPVGDGEPGRRQPVPATTSPSRPPSRNATGGAPTATPTSTRASSRTSTATASPTG